MLPTFTKMPICLESSSPIVSFCYFCLQVDVYIRTVGRYNYFVSIFQAMGERGVIAFSFCSFYRLFRRAVQLFPSSAGSFVALCNVFIVVVSRCNYPESPTNQRFNECNFPDLPSFVRDDVISYGCRRIELFEVGCFFSRVSRCSIFLLVVSRIRVNGLYCLGFAVKVGTSFVKDLLHLSGRTK